MPALLVGSLCSGYGGLELGILLAAYRLGIPARVAWQLDYEPYCAAILRARGDVFGHPRVYHMNMNHIARGMLAPVDIVCAGLPCQPFSITGSQRGEADERNLFPKFFEIMDWLQPRSVLLENVPALQTIDGGRTFERIINQLATRWQHIEWGIVSAASVGAPHIRRRVFITASNTAYDDSIGHCRAQAFSEFRENKVGDVSPQVCRGENIFNAPVAGGATAADADGANVPTRLCVLGQSQVATIKRSALRTAEPGMGRTPDGIAVGMDFALQHRFPRAEYQR